MVSVTRRSERDADQPPRPRGEFTLLPAYVWSVAELATEWCCWRRVVAAPGASLGGWALGTLPHCQEVRGRRHGRARGRTRLGQYQQRQQHAASGEVQRLPPAAPLSGGGPQPGMTIAESISDACSSVAELCSL